MYLLNRKSFLIVFSFFMAFSLFSKELTNNEAAKIAKEYLLNKNTCFKSEIKNVDAVEHNSVKLYYVVNFTPNGWVLVSANDAVNSIIAYATEGNFEQNNQPEPMKLWLDTYKKEIFDAVKNDSKVISGIKTGSTQAALRKTKRITAYNKVDPLITVNWNQSKPYNTYCPSNSSGTALVGCVAVAMGQAVSVSKYPPKPVGTFSYHHTTYGNIFIDYDKEPAYNWNDILSGANNKSEVARLLYHCGVSVSMDYSPTGSGTQSAYVVSALKRNFSYAPSVKIHSRSSYTGDWEELLLNELQAGRSVVYSGNNGGVGHAFNLDGFDGNNMYHVNWGWGGQNNGYYTIDGMKDGDMNYTQNQQMIVGIRPPSNGPSDIVLSNSSIEEGKDIGTYVADVIVESEAVNPIYTYELKGNYSVILHDYMPAQFYVENNKLMTKAVFDYADGNQTVTIKAINNNNRLSYEREFTINVTEKKTSVNKMNIQGLSIVKKHKNKITIYSPGNFNYRILSTMGQEILTGKILEGENDIFVNNVHGIYMVNVFDNTKTHTEKIIL